MGKAFYSISELSRMWGIQPRKISDAFYARKLSDERCEFVGGRRFIPADYIAEVLRILREAGVLDNPILEAAK
jgi:hypothetical protein